MTTDEHARALGFVKLTGTDEDKGEVYVAWDEFGDVMAMRPRDRDGYTAYRNRRGAYWNYVRETPAEVLRLIWEAREAARGALFVRCVTCGKALDLHGPVVDGADGPRHVECAQGRTR